MADFPADPSGATTKPIQAGISPGEIAGPYSLLAHGLEKTGEAADSVASLAGG